jgi:hypothetical protein
MFVGTSDGIREQARVSVAHIQDPYLGPELKRQIAAVRRGRRFHIRTLVKLKIQDRAMSAPALGEKKRQYEQCDDSQSRTRVFA